MKKGLRILAIVVLFASSAINVNAQDKSKFQFGIKAGFQSSSNTGKGARSRIGLLAGGYATFSLSENISLQPELLYSSYGFLMNKTDQLSGMSYEMNTATNYLSIPVLAKCSFGVNGLSVVAGPQLGFLLSAKGKANVLGIDLYEDVKNRSNKIDLSAAFGVEYAFDFGVNVSARYTSGLTNLSKVSNFGSKNYALQLTVGYTLFK